MATRFFGEPITRNEDPHLLTGQALFVDDVHLPNLAHAAFVRSLYAHARFEFGRIYALQKYDGHPKKARLLIF